MKLKEWLMAKKKRREARRKEKLELKRSAAGPEVMQLDADEAGIVPPESRFTDEYREFLKRQEENNSQAEISREER